MTFSGKSFCESTFKGSELLGSTLGRAVLTDHLGLRIISWSSYVLALCSGFAAWAWADSVQRISTFAEMELSQSIVVVILFACLLHYPLITLVLVVFTENNLGLFLDTVSQDLRARVNSVATSLFVGSLSTFILATFLRLVVNAMDVIFFCFAVESDNQGQQERFASLYFSIKSTVVEGGAHGVIVDSTATEESQPESRHVQSCG